MGGLLIAASGVQPSTLARRVRGHVRLDPCRPLAARPRRGGEQPIGRSILEGLRFVRGNRALAGLVRDRPGRDGLRDAARPVRGALPDRLPCGRGRHRPALRVGVGGRGRGGADDGLAGARRWLGRITIVAVGVWGVAIALAGLAPSIWVCARCSRSPARADSVSAVCRTAINQTVTPEHMRGRMSSVFTLVVTGGPRLGRHRVRDRRVAAVGHRRGGQRWRPVPGLRRPHGVPVSGAGPLRRARRGHEVGHNRVGDPP